MDYLGDFHPRYGFTFTRDVNGTFACQTKSNLYYNSILIVNMNQNSKISSSEITEFTSSILTVECESRGILRANKCRGPFLDIKLVNITKKETKLSGGGQLASSYEIVTNISDCLRFTCVDEEHKRIWEKEVEFVRKYGALHAQKIIE
jgi:hypothetical protein